jgi:K(+)-stimulated pyrophosphate-energized sodium pump
MDNLFWLGFVGALVAGLFAFMQAKKVLSYSEGTERMQKIAASTINKGFSPKSEQREKLQNSPF